jgi:hypothetical protein
MAFEPTQIVQLCIDLRLIRRVTTAAQLGGSRVIAATSSITQRDVIGPRNLLPAESSRCGMTGLEVAVLGL